MSGRLTVIEQIVHYSDDTRMPMEYSPPVSTRMLTSGEQPWGPRHLMVCDAWLPLDTGWIEGVGLLVVVNNESRQDVAKVVLVGMQCINGDWLTIARIRPGESLRAELMNNPTAFRCVDGKARMTVVAYPE